MSACVFFKLTFVTVVATISYNCFDLPNNMSYHSISFLKIFMQLQSKEDEKLAKILQLQKIHQQEVHGGANGSSRGNAASRPTQLKTQHNSRSPKMLSPGTLYTLCKHLCQPDLYENPLSPVRDSGK